MQNDDKSLRPVDKSMQKTNSAKTNKSMQNDDNSLRPVDKSAEKTNKSMQQVNESLQKGDRSSQRVSMQEVDNLPLPPLDIFVHKFNKPMQNFDKSIQKIDKSMQQVGKSMHFKTNIEEPITESDQEVMIVDGPVGKDIKERLQMSERNPLLTTVLDVLTESEDYKKAHPKDKIVQARVECISCPLMAHQDHVSLDIPSKHCLRHYFGPSSTACWLPDILIHSFGLLCTHRNHHDNMIFYDVAQIVSAKDMESLKDAVGRPSSLLQDNPKVNEIIVLATGNRHYVVLQLLVEQKHCVVYDGMRTTNMRGWSDVTKMLFWKFGIHKMSNMDAVSVVEKLDTLAPNRNWSISQDPKICGLQHDSHSCGPIAMLIITSLFHTAKDKGSMHLSQFHPGNMNKQQWRENVSNLFKTYIGFAWGNLYSQKIIPLEQRRNIYDFHVGEQCNNFLDEKSITRKKAPSNSEQPSNSEAPTEDQSTTVPLRRSARNLSKR